MLKSPDLSSLNLYLVGGAVRDKILGLPSKDKDYVVVGSSPEEMLRLGFLPIGKDFPVFLHPETKEEYALARKDFKQGLGHKAFEIKYDKSITLKEDLFRRDLSINSMAQRLDTGEIIDPFGGQKDIRNKLLRATSSHFSEDPLRLLRLARFYARFENFEIEKKTKIQLKDIVKSKELLSLSAERIWQETRAAILESHKASIYFSALKELGALQQVFPELDELDSQDWLESLLLLDKAQTHKLDLQPTLTLFFSGIKKIEKIQTLCKRLKLSNKLCKSCFLFCKNQNLLDKPLKSSPQEILDFLKNCKALSQDNLFEILLTCYQIKNLKNKTETQQILNFWESVLKKCRALSLEEEQLKTLKGPEISRFLSESRMKEISKIQQQLES